MLTSMVFYLTLACVGTSVAALVILGNVISSMVQGDDRSSMAPLPSFLRLVWPVIQVIAYFGCSWLPYEFLEAIEKRLQRAGVSYLLTAEQFLALQIFSIVAWPIVTLLSMALLNFHSPWEPWIVLGAVLLGVAHPNMWLADTRKRRENAIIRGLPTYLDFVTMCVEAGLNFQGALQQAMDKAPGSPLRNEFAIVLRDLRSGLPRAETLRRMANRLDIQECDQLRQRRDSIRTHGRESRHGDAGAGGTTPDRRLSTRGKARDGNADQTGRTVDHLHLSGDLHRPGLSDRNEVSQPRHTMIEGRLVDGEGECRVRRCLRTTNMRERMRGLLLRPPLGPATGLLIIPCASVHTFGMGFAIDVIFLDARMKILKRVERLPPWRMSACAAASATLELAAGEAASLGLSPGLALTWQGP